METLLLGIHTTLAAATNVPELALSQPEAQKLAAAISAVQEQFPVTRIDPKVACLVQLAGTVGVIYGTRFVAIRLRQRGERSYRPAPQPQPQQPQPTRAEPMPAADTFNPGEHMAPFGQEGAGPGTPPLDFPIIRQ